MITQRCTGDCAIQSDTHDALGRRSPSAPAFLNALMPCLKAFACFVQPADTIEVTIVSGAGGHIEQLDDAA